MTNIAVFIDNIEKDIRLFLTIHTEDIKQVEMMWDEKIKIFGKRKSKWSELSMLTYKMIIIDSIEDLFNGDYEKKSHGQLRFLLAAMSKRMYDLTDTHVEVIRIKYISREKTSFSMEMNTIITIEEHENINRQLKLIVDNTK
ncbi:MAG: hypothetical protein WC284_08405 [Candidimonas sp.]